MIKRPLSCATEAVKYSQTPTSTKQSSVARPTLVLSTAIGNKHPGSNYFHAIALAFTNLVCAYLFAG